MTLEESILQDYKNELPLLENCKDIYLEFVKDMLADDNIQSLSARVKSFESYQNKIAKYKDGDPALLKLPTDKIGIRVVTYFNEDALFLAGKFSEYLEIDHTNSMDKASLQSYDRFGYLSIHLVASFKEDQFDSSKYEICQTTCVEIQIRTVIQHAWAEIEHDIGYKSKHGIPLQMRRRFARLAGLLEIADCEFSELRKEAQSYEMDAMQRETLHGKSQLTIAGIEHFIHNNDEMVKARDAIKKNRGFFYTEHVADPAGYYITALPQVGIYDTQSLEANLIKHNSDIVGYARLHYPGPSLSKKRPDALPFGHPINILINILTEQIQPTSEK